MRDGWLAGLRGEGVSKKASMFVPEKNMKNVAAMATAHRIEMSSAVNWIDYRTVRPLCFPRDDSAVFPEQAIVVLPREERQALLEMILTLQTNPYLGEQQESFISSSKEIAVQALSKATLCRIRAELDFGLGAVLVCGLPVDPDLPDTPVRGGSLPPDYKKTFVCEALLLALGSMTGAEPFNFRQEGRGTAPLIDNVVSIRELKAVKGSGGYENNFPFHCESTWHRKRPDYLVLVGIREDSMAKTLLFSTEMLDPVIEMLTPAEAEGRFRLGGPELYDQMESIGIPLGTAKHVFLNPIESLTTGLKLNLNFNGSDCADLAAVEWLSKLETYIEGKAVAAVLRPGDALILNNDRVCHTRNGYSPSFDGRGRWLVRGYFKKDLWALDSSPLENGSEICSEQDFDDLLELGWMTETRHLTSEFFKYIQQPNLMMSLGRRENRLAAIAVHFTPVEGTRLV